MDQVLFHLINERWTNPALDLFMGAISNVEIWKPFLVLFVLYALIFRGFRGRAFVLTVLLTLLISEQALVRPLKSLVDRRRPKQSQRVRMVELAKARPEFLTLFKRPTIHYSDASDRTKSGPSFPSGHVTNNVVIATLCTLFFRRWGWLYFIVAAAISYSRIYLGAHWPSDVLATFFMAAGEALLIAGLLELVWKKAAPRVVPRIYAAHPRLIGGGRLPPSPRRVNSDASLPSDERS
ncbi:MAG: phosphatase PAP2 family protein [Chthoniobacterales bacterium]